MHALNTTIPTPSFAVKGTDPAGQCKELHRQVSISSHFACCPWLLICFVFPQLEESHKNREATIKKCILQVSEQVHHLKKLREEDEANVEVQRDLRKEQNKLRLMQTELNVEEVIKDRSTKAFYERCRPFYRPDV